MPGVQVCQLTSRHRYHGFYSSDKSPRLTKIVGRNCSYAIGFRRTIALQDSTTDESLAMLSAQQNLRTLEKIQSFKLESVSLPHTPLRFLSEKKTSVTEPSAW